MAFKLESKEIIDTVGEAHRRPKGTYLKQRENIRIYVILEKPNAYQVCMHEFQDISGFMHIYF